MSDTDLNECPMAAHHHLMSKCGSCDYVHTGHVAPMSDTEYTPSIEQLRETYRLSDADKADLPELDWSRIVTVEAFDRALAAHDAELTARVRAEQRETDAQIAEAKTIGWNHDYDNGCFDAAAAIREAGKQ